MPEEVRRNISRLVTTLLEPARTLLGRPIHVNSGYRCPDYNRRVGGAVHSQHMYGRAADITIRGLDPECVAEIFHGHLIANENIGPGGVGKYSGFTHVDIRETDYPKRWPRNAFTSIDEQG